MTEFVHLHVHSEYSLLLAANRIDALVDQAVKYGMPALALTDHGNLFGAIEFYDKARSKGVRPIIGCEVYVAPGNRTERDHRGLSEASFHLTLLAENEIGYRNLLKLVTLAYFEGFYYRPRVDKELLRNYHEGLLCLSGCLWGEIGHYLQRGDEEKALQVALEYRNIFGAENFFLEIQKNDLTLQARVNEGLYKIRQALNIPFVATNDCHYLHKEEAEAHRRLLEIQSGGGLREREEIQFKSDQFFFRSPDEMKELFQDCPEALQITVEIANRCRLELPLGEYHLPKFSPPSGMSLDDYLEQQAVLGLNQRLGKSPSLAPEKREFYLERLRSEIDIIKKTAFSGYFLVVADFVNYAKQNAIPVGPGRGSAAGSLVAYSLGITDIDPMQYNLLFERFLNPERISMPDIDMDFCMERRDEVLRYVSQKYGSDKVAQIITFGTMQAKGVIRDVGRVMGLPYGEVDKIAKMVPNGLNITLDDALNQEARLRELVRQNETVATLMKTAKSLEGLARHASIHAAGVVLSDRLLVELVPLYRGTDGEVMTQYDMKGLERVGLIKFDFLGLKTLTVLDKAIKIIRRNRTVSLDLQGLPLNDLKTYQLLCSGQTTGIFQLESSGMRDLLTKLRPEQFEDLIALVALYRPGPLGSGMVDDFIQRRHGKGQSKYELPQMESILKETYGVIVYQEQVMRIASELANFTLGEADILRRAMGKKKPEEMAKQRKRFLEGAHRNKILPKKAEKIFDLMAKFAEYGFNKSHSAAYAMISFQTAYLKAHYPVEFMAALLTIDSSDTDKVFKYISECRALGIQVLPPDINESYRDFSVVGETIRFGLAAVKNVGGAAVDAILEAREGKERFTSLKNLCERVDLRRVNKRVLESLIKCGSFDSLNEPRWELMAQLESAMEFGVQSQKDRAQGQALLFDATPSGMTAEASQRLEPWPEGRLLSYEKEALGFYITGHPLHRFEAELKKLKQTPIDQLATLQDGSEVRVAGMPIQVKQIQTKKGDPMAFLTVEDLTGAMEIVVFSDLYLRVRPILSGEDPLLVKGRLDLGTERPKLVANDISPLGQSSTARSVHIQWDVTRTTEQDLERLKALLSSRSGGNPTFLHIWIPPKTEVILRLPSNYSADSDREFLDQLRSEYSARLDFGSTKTEERPREFDTKNAPF
jgi:DNA polymerase-3 subunit alpha